MIPAGAHVLILNLDRATDLNGSTGVTIRDFNNDDEAGRVSVSMDDDDRRVAVRPANLRIVDLRETWAARDAAEGATVPPLLSLPDGVPEMVLAFAGAASAAASGRSCAQLHRIERASWRAWQRFVSHGFGFGDVIDWWSPTAADAELETTARGDVIDWRSVFACCAHAMRAEAEGGWPSLHSRVVEHSDFRGEFRAFHPPEAAVALPNSPDSCWCTSSNIHANVDVAAEFVGHDSAFGEFALVLGVAVSNCAAHVGDNPAADVLAFLSYNMPNFVRPEGRAVEFDDGGRSAASQRVVHALAENDGSSVRRPEPGHPAARCTFPPCPDAFDMRVVRRCAPTVARFVHFKVLSSHNPNGHADANVDVHELHAVGVLLPGLAGMLPLPIYCTQYRERSRYDYSHRRVS